MRFAIFHEFTNQYLHLLYISFVPLDSWFNPVGFKVTQYSKLSYYSSTLYAELLDEQEFGKASADFDETRINPAAELGLTVGI